PVMKIKHKTKLAGDLRLRFDTQMRSFDNPEDEYNRNRWRYRLRFGIYFEPHKTVDLGIRVVSGQGFQNTTNQSYGDHARGDDIFLDLVYADWHPHKAVNIIGGKFKNIFFTSPLVWDPDVNLEGLGFKFKHGSDTVKAFAGVSEFFVEELNIKALSDDDPVMTGLQGGVEFSPTEKAVITAGVTYYDFRHMQWLGDTGIGDKTTLVGYNHAHGQQMVFDEDGRLLNTWKCIEFGLKAKYKSSLPFAGFFYYIKNNDSDIGFLIENGVATDESDPADLVAYGDDDREDGWQVGFEVGKKKEKGAFWAQYFYQSLKDYAFPAVFVDSDFHGGGTNNKGHRIKANYYIQKWVYLQGAFFFTKRESEAKDGKMDADRVQLDVIFKL
ncbi:putative porin, partial [Acidobacteriota bacterium]